MAPASVAVVGAGISGLVAAESLTRAGLEVTLLEASDRPGGQILSVPFAGHTLDVGAEALHLAGPPLTDLVEHLGLTDRLIRAEGGRTWIWTGRKLRRLPAGVGPAGPTRLSPVMRSGLLGPVALARAALEPLVPAGPLGDGTVGEVSVGDYLGRRFGSGVVQRLVDPLLGNLHAGDVSRLGLRSATPYLAARAARSRSLLLAGSAGGGPAEGATAFATFEAGLSGLVDALVDRLGPSMRTVTAVRRVRPAGDRVTLDVGGREETFDAAVLAVPAHAVAAMLGDGSQPGTALGAVRTASVVTVLAAYDAAAAEATPALRANGLLVPSTEGRFLKASTFLSTKWPHLQGGPRFLVRLSAGRAGEQDVTALGDDELVGRLHADLAAATGLRSEPEAALVQRWPRAMPQLEVGHANRIAAAADELAASGPVVLAGAPYLGIGIASCVRSGVLAAEAVRSRRPERAGAA